MQPTIQGTIYFDGLCRVCSAEINHYRRLTGSENFLFVDILSADFDAKKHGLDPSQVHKVMHVRDKAGRLYTGVDAFRAIWQEIPRYRRLAKWSENRIVRLGLEFGYETFVKIRPYLPRRKADCAASPYCEIAK